MHSGKDFQFDNRIYQLNVRLGNVETKDYEAFLKSLPDLKNQSEEFNVYEEGNGSEPTFAGIEEKK